MREPLKIQITVLEPYKLRVEIQHGFDEAACQFEADQGEAQKNIKWHLMEYVKRCSSPQSNFSPHR